MVVVVIIGKVVGAGADADADAMQAVCLYLTYRR